ncbi:hypothetical protein CASFOL_005400 [Castilleja foliolosa]|uniref:X-ray induced transcript 1 n=1 Tax=Castilleja foliolosa TaxID=1961234 RepID=A0ABD3E5B5_9LAMI
MNSEVWDWQNQDCIIIEDNTDIDILNHSEDHISCTFDDTTTPVKACGDLAYSLTGNEGMNKESELYREHSSQVKRRRMLQFEPEVLDTNLFNDEMFLRSKETSDSLEDAISDMSQWVAGFAEGPSLLADEYLDPTTEGWIADCFNDTEMNLSTDDIGCASGESDIQIDVTELCNTTPPPEPECDVNVVDKLPVRTSRNVAFKGRKSYMRTPPKRPSSIVYPFTFIKPCSMLGDMTLMDINQRIHNPPKSKQNEQDDDSFSYQTSAFSGKPVVGKTKIRTEGGEGCITIVRTKG